MKALGNPIAVATRCTNPIPRNHRSPRLRLAKLTTMVAATSLLTVPAWSYSTKDAHFVTSSRDPAVLTYVVCLEKHMRRVGETEIMPALERATASCRKLEQRLPTCSSEPNAKDIQQMILECGFRPGDGNPDMGCE